MVWFVVSLQLDVFGCSFYTKTNGFDTLDQVGHLGSLCILHRKTNGFDTLALFGHLGSRQGSSVALVSFELTLADSASFGLRQAEHPLNLTLDFG